MSRIYWMCNALYRPVVLILTACYNYLGSFKKITVLKACLLRYWINWSRMGPRHWYSANSKVQPELRASARECDRALGLSPKISITLVNTLKQVKCHLLVFHCTLDVQNSLILKINVLLKWSHISVSWNLGHLSLVTKTDSSIT